VRERIIGELVTVDGAWRVQAVERRHGHWYRLVGPDGGHDGLSIATVERLLREAGIDMAELVPVEGAA
jgi:bifunctional non-homologous end joining protein LigD